MGRVTRVGWAAITADQALAARLASYTRDGKGRAVFSPQAPVKPDLWGRLTPRRIPRDRGAWVCCGRGGFVALICAPRSEPEGAAETETAERLLALLGQTSGSAELPPVRYVGESMIHGWAALLKVSGGWLRGPQMIRTADWALSMRADDGTVAAEGGGMALFGPDPWLRDYTWPRGFGTVLLTRWQAQDYWTAAEALLGARRTDPAVRWTSRPPAGEEPDEWPLLLNRGMAEWRRGLFAAADRRKEITLRLRDWMIRNEADGWPVPPSLEYIAWHFLRVDLCERGTSGLRRGLEICLRSLGYEERTVRSRGGCIFAKLWLPSQLGAAATCRF